jgi:hypothetical protein
MEALSYYETSVLTRATRRNIPENSIPHSHRCENLKSYTSSLHRKFRISAILSVVPHRQNLKILIYFSFYLEERMLYNEMFKRTNRAILWHFPCQGYRRGIEIHSNLIQMFLTKFRLRVYIFTAKTWSFEEVPKAYKFTQLISLQFVANDRLRW